MADGAFELTPKQAEAQEILNGPARHILLAGGSRSGKTFLIVRKIIQRALKAPMSRHLIARFRLSHVRQSIAHDTLPKVMQLCFPGVPYELNKAELYLTLPGGSQIWLGGLDDKQRTEKILGTEYASIFLNECSQINWGPRNTVLTRLAQKVHDRATGKDLVTKAYYDANPPSKAHWTYRLFVAHQDPEDSSKAVEAANHVFMRLNPGDNVRNLSTDYLAHLEGLPARDRKRYLLGDFADANPNALFPEEIIDHCRVTDAELPEMLRVVIAVDPSGAEDEDAPGEHDDIGIVVCGLGIDGHGYILEDCTVHAGPATWGRVAVQAYERHRADRVVGETNFGGGMVGHVIQTARARTPFQKVTASRGKVVRADPIAALMEQDKVRIVGYMRELEEELAGFTTFGYVGERSPNRADAMIWGMSALFPGLTQPERSTMKPVTVRPLRRGGWMSNL